MFSSASDRKSLKLIANSRFPFSPAWIPGLPKLWATWQNKRTVNEIKRKLLWKKLFSSLCGIYPAMPSEHSLIDNDQLLSYL